MSSVKKLGEYSLNAPKRNGEPGRDVTMGVSAEEIRLIGKGKSLSLQVIFAKERNPSAGAKGVEWMLLTDIVVESFERARILIEWYRCRWEIETYF